MNPLLQAQSCLVTALLADPVTALASAAAWLDPMGLSDMDSDRYYAGDEDNDLEYALSVCRVCFRDVYADVVQRLWRGEGYVALNRAICDGANRYLIAELNDVEEFKFGVPFEALGVDVDEYFGELAEMAPRLVPIAAWFGISDKGNADHAREVATRLIANLEPYGEDCPHADLANLLRWLFGMSGNTLVDYTQDMLWDAGIETAPWTPDDIQHMNGVQEEANEMVASALRALELLEQDNVWAEALQHNIRLITGRKAKRDRTTLQWPQYARCDDPNATEPHP
jgi:hypothetical protein